VAGPVPLFPSSVFRPERRYVTRNRLVNTLTTREDPSLECRLDAITGQASDMATTGHVDSFRLGDHSTTIASLRMWRSCGVEPLSAPDSRKQGCRADWNTLI
jgi:hypothetical protein